MIEGSLEVKLPTIWTNGKAQVRRVREEKRREEKKREEERRSKIKDQRSEIREEKESEERVTRKSQKKESEERVRRKKIQVREKVGKSRNTVFSMTSGSGGSKSRLAKAAGAEPSGQMRD